MRKQGRQRPQHRESAVDPSGRWSLQTAKARLSEVVRRARDDGPQRITVRGYETVVILSVEDYDRLVRTSPHLPLVEFMESLSLSELDVGRESDVGRHIHFMET